MAAWNGAHVSTGEACWGDAGGGSICCCWEAPLIALLADGERSVEEASGSSRKTDPRRPPTFMNDRLAWRCSDAPPPAAPPAWYDWGRLLLDNGRRRGVEATDRRLNTGELSGVAAVIAVATGDIAEKDDFCCCRGSKIIDPPTRMD